MATKKLHQLNPTRLARAYKMNHSEARLFKLLLESPSVLPGAIEKRLGYNSPAKMMVHRLRISLRRHRLKVHSRRGLGYWITPQHKAAVYTNATSIAAA